MEYVADELASDSDDEKKLEKVEKVADRRAQRMRKRKQNFSLGRRKGRGPLCQFTVSKAPQEDPWELVGSFSTQCQVGQKGGASASLGAAKPIGPCFHCL